MSCFPVRGLPRGTPVINVDPSRRWHAQSSATGTSGPSRRTTADSGSGSATRPTARCWSSHAARSSNWRRARETRRASVTYCLKAPELRREADPEHRSLPAHEPLRQHEVDLRAVEVHPYQLDAQAIAEPVALPGAFPHELVLRALEVVVIVAQLGDVHQPFDIELVERDEDTEGGNRADTAHERFAHFVAHVIRLQPVHHVPGCLVGATLGHGAVRTERMPIAWLVALALEHRLDRTVHEKVGVTADRRGEMRV